MSPLLTALSRAYPLLVIAALWELFPRTGLVSTELVPPLSSVAERLWELTRTGEVPMHAAHSLYRAVAGLVIAVAVGVPLGIRIGWSPRLYTFVNPLLVAGYPLPKPALIPLFMLWLGTGDASKIAAIAMACVLPLVVTTYHGARGVDRHVIWSARSTGASERRVLRDIVLSAALPQILTGVKIGIAVSFLTVVSAEMVAAKNGLGYLVFVSMETGDYSVMLAGALAVVLVAFACDAAFTAYMARALKWQQQSADAERHAGA